MNSGFTEANYTQLTEIYNRYKDKGLCFSINFLIYMYVWLCMSSCIYVLTCI